MGRSAANRQGIVKEFPVSGEWSPWVKLLGSPMIAYNNKHGKIVTIPSEHNQEL